MSVEIGGDEGGLGLAVGEVAGRHREGELRVLLEELSLELAHQNLVDLVQIAARHGHRTAHGGALEGHGVERGLVALHLDGGSLLHRSLDALAAVEVAQGDAGPVVLDVGALHHQLLGVAAHDGGLVAGGHPLGREDHGLDGSHVAAGDEHLVAHVDRRLEDGGGDLRSGVAVDEIAARNARSGGVLQRDASAAGLGRSQDRQTRIGYALDDGNLYTVDRGSGHRVQKRTRDDDLLTDGGRCGREGVDAGSRNDLLVDIRLVAGRGEQKGRRRDKTQYAVD